jgi:hypothetical protein
MPGILKPLLNPRVGKSYPDLTLIGPERKVILRSPLITTNNPHLLVVINTRRKTYPPQNANCRRVLLLPLLVGVMSVTEKNTQRTYVLSMLGTLMLIRMLRLLFPTLRKGRST